MSEMGDLLRAKAQAGKRRRVFFFVTEGKQVLAMSSKCGDRGAAPVATCFPQVLIYFGEDLQPFSPENHLKMKKFGHLLSLQSHWANR